MLRNMKGGTRTPCCETSLKIAWGEALVGAKLSALVRQPTFSRCQDTTNEGKVSRKGAFSRHMIASTAGEH